MMGDDALLDVSRWLQSYMPHELLQSTTSSIGVIELASILGKYWSSSLFFFFASLWTEPQAGSINLQKKNETNIFPVRTEQASSIKFLLSWLYFEFPGGTAHLIGETRALL